MNNYIYKVTDKVTGQFYIGSQCRSLQIGVNYFTSSSDKIFKSKFKTNPSQFNIKIIGVFADPYSCVLQENIFIKDNIKNPLCINRSYIIGNKIQFNKSGIPNSIEAKKRISEAHKGILFSNKHKENISKAKKGTICSEETKKKISKSNKGHIPYNKGKPISVDIKNKLSEINNGKNNPFYGKTHSLETRKKISEIHKGKIPCNKGKHHSEETKKKIGEKSKNRNNKKVICIETQIIYNSITEAGIKNNINPTYIGSCANYKLKTVNGYHWSFYDEAQKEKYTLENILKIIDDKMPNKLKKKVICKETQIIYNSTTEAAKAVGILPGNITNCAKKNRKTAGGYHWEYVK